MKLRQSELGSARTITVSTDAELTDRQTQLESDLSLKKLEVQSLRDQISQMKNQESGAVTSRTEINEKITEINTLRQDLERTKKDKNITSGLVTQMQRDMTNKVSLKEAVAIYLGSVKLQMKTVLLNIVQKTQCCLQDTTISRLTRELENLKKESADKTVMLTSMQTKVCSFN